MGLRFPITGSKIVKSYLEYLFFKYSTFYSFLVQGEISAQNFIPLKSASKYVACRWLHSCFLRLQQLVLYSIFTKIAPMKSQAAFIQDLGFKEKS